MEENFPNLSTGVDLNTKQSNCFLGGESIFILQMKGYRI